MDTVLCKEGDLPNATPKEVNERKQPRLPDAAFAGRLQQFEEDIAEAHTKEMNAWDKTVNTKWKPGTKWAGKTWKERTHDWGFETWHATLTAMHPNSALSAP